MSPKPFSAALKRLLDIFLLISLTWGLADFPFGDEPCCTLVLGALWLSHGLLQLIISIPLSSLSYFIMFCWKGFLEHTAWRHFSLILPFHKNCLGRFELATRKSLDYKHLSHNLTQALQKKTQNILKLSFLSEPSWAALDLSPSQPLLLREAALKESDRTTRHKSNIHKKTTSDTNKYNLPPFQAL